jgi:mannose/fructose/N-acetylgalactosamine-specific phosphotransferase system component IID
MVVGAMTASMIDITTPLSFTAGQTTMKAQEFIDKIFLLLLPLFTLGMYKLIRKGVNINWILLEPSRLAWRPARACFKKRNITHARRRLYE